MGYERSQDSLANPVEWKMGSGDKIRLRGVIDRIDRKDDGSFAVWDYKTGAHESMQITSTCAEGVRCSMPYPSPEKILATQGSLIRVQEAGYYFPPKGEGRRTAARTNEPWFWRLNHLFDLLKTGFSRLLKMRTLRVPDHIRFGTRLQFLESKPCWRLRWLWSPEEECDWVKP